MRAAGDSGLIARKAFEFDSTSWQANSVLSRALFGLNQYKEAEAHAGAAVKLQPNNQALHLVLADIHIKLRNDLAVLDDLNAYLQLDPMGPLLVKHVQNGMKSSEPQLRQKQQLRHCVVRKGDRLRCIFSPRLGQLNIKCVRGSPAV